MTFHTLHNTSAPTSDKPGAVFEPDNLRHSLPPCVRRILAQLQAGLLRLLRLQLRQVFY